MGSAERAEATTRRRDEASADRRRRDELRHIAELERRRREVSRPIFASIPAPVVRRAKEGGERVDFKYDVCLSFAGEQRGYVELVATGLKARGMRVFYDQDEQIDLWGKDLAEHFDRVYRIESRYCVMFISKEYADKPWTRHERRSALARALAEESEYVLPVRFDETELPGLRPTTGYLELAQIAPDTLVDFICEKVAPPEDPPAPQGT